MKSYSFSESNLEATVTIFPTFLSTLLRKPGLFESLVTSRLSMPDFDWAEAILAAAIPAPPVVLVDRWITRIIE
jgi:hypothetical protein